MWKMANTARTGSQKNKLIVNSVLNFRIVTHFQLCLLEMQALGIQMLVGVYLDTRRSSTTTSKSAERGKYEALVVVL